MRRLENTFQRTVYIISMSQPKNMKSIQPQTIKDYCNNTPYVPYAVQHMVPVLVVKLQLEPLL